MSFLVDLHVHSSASPCSVLTAETVAREARARQLDAVAVVDHDRFPDASFLRSLREWGVHAYAGAEVETAEGDLLVFGIPELPPPGLGGVEVVRWVWARGGAAVAAHPFRRSRPSRPSLIRLRDLPLECANGRNTEAENGQAHRAWRRRGGASTGGSDAHLPGELGICATRFDALPADEVELSRLLREGRCTAWAPAAAARTGTRDAA